MKLYLIAEVEVLDAEKYAEYRREAEPIVIRHGGRYLVRGGSVTPLAGGWNPERLIVIEFQSRDHAEACFASGEYQRIAPLRLASTRSRSLMVEGVSHP